MSQRVPRLLSWCQAQGIALINIKLVDHDPSYATDKIGISVIAQRDLSHSDIVVKIPKTMVLSRKTSPLSTPSRTEITGDDMMELSLVLAYEIALGERSKWLEYLLSLPQEQVPVAALWEGNNDQDSQLAFSWLQGTETSRAINPSGAGCSISQNLVNYYHQIASPILIDSGYKTTLSDFQRAWSLVSSRSFRVDAYHGLAMVPIADAFNHTGANQVHIETDFDVCSTCGSLQSCPHDDDDEPQNAASLAGPLFSIEDTCDMVINAPVETGDEVFNSYDANLPNSMLLARYGFILEGNEYDYISWDSTDLPRSMQNCTTNLWEDLSRVWTEDLLTRTSLVYDPSEPSVTLPLHADPAAHGRSSHRTPQYKLNADGLVSIDLWIVAASCALKIAGASFADTISRPRVERLATAQVYAENREQEGPHKDPGSGVLAGVLLEIRLIANLIQDVCRTRLLGMYRPELSATQCGDLLDNIPEGMPRSRLALSQALSERATLSACIDGWHDLSESVDETPS